MADMTSRLCLLLLALASPVLAHGAVDNCSASAPVPASDIDYPALNQALLMAEAAPRLQALQAELRKLELSRAPEATLVRHRLLLAIARTQHQLGMNVAAMGNLKRLPATSPQAPEALMLMAEIEVANGQQRAAVRWLRHLADLFPEEPVTVHALWRAAELNHPSSRQAIALWQEAARQADRGLAGAQDWHARSQQPGFVEEVSRDKLSPELWRLARSTFMDPAFAGADKAQAEARRQLQCLSAAQGAQVQRMGQRGGALADLNNRLGESRTRMHALLQQRLEAAVKDWEALSAEAHFRLADAQEPRIHPGLVPRK